MVSYPQAGHRFTFLSRPKKGMMGMKRNTKKKGKPREKRMTVTAIEPARRITAS